MAKDPWYIQKKETNLLIEQQDSISFELWKKIIDEDKSFKWLHEDNGYLNDIKNNNSSIDYYEKALWYSNLNVKSIADFMIEYRSYPYKGVRLCVYLGTINDESIKKIFELADVFGCIIEGEEGIVLKFEDYKF